MAYNSMTNSANAAFQPGHNPAAMPAGQPSMAVQNPRAPQPVGQPGGPQGSVAPGVLPGAWNPPLGVPQMPGQAMGQPAQSMPESIMQMPQGGVQMPGMAHGMAPGGPGGAFAAAPHGVMFGNQPAGGLFQASGGGQGAFGMGMGRRG